MSNEKVQQFEAYRSLMFSIAYRMLGSATEAEDMVQETYLRYQATPLKEIVSPKAYLSTIITRLCLNHLQSARSRRELYVGTWLPEPLLTERDEQSEPPHRAELYESLSLAFLVLLEQLSPPERAVFLLREVFEYGYKEIAAIMDKEEAACRQLFSRAKKHIAEHRPRFKPAPETHRQILNQFVQALGSGELDRLLNLLTEDVELWADGGGKLLRAIIRPLYGRDAVARFLRASPQHAPPSLEAGVSEVNGEPALILRMDNRVYLVAFVSIEAGRISAIRAIGNPDKLARISEQMRNRESE